MVIKCIVFLKENTLNQCLGKAFSLIKWNALIICLMYVIFNLMALMLSERSLGFLSQYRKARNEKAEKARGRDEKISVGTKN